MAAVYYERGDATHRWLNRNRRSTIPLHIETRDVLANKICKNLGVKRI